MSWALYRWVWQLEGPLHIGMPPAGSLNRTRLYVPASALWGALTAELSRREAEQKDPQYQVVGESLHDGYRFSYLFPAERIGDEWNGWLPGWRDGIGLAWHREGTESQLVNDRQFRRRLLSTRPGTSIDPRTDAADDGSLRETECIERNWRDDHGCDSGPVAMLGYVFIIRAARRKDKYPPGRRRLDGVDTLFVGGDTRYGLGRLRRVSFEFAPQGEGAFGKSVHLDTDDPQIEASEAWAHVRGGDSLSGALELLGGWDRGSIRTLDQGAPVWQPGSRSASALRWAIARDGLWRVVT